MHRTIDNSPTLITSKDTVHCEQNQHAVSDCLAHMKLDVMLHPKQIMLPCGALLVFDFSVCQVMVKLPSIIRSASML